MNQILSLLQWFLEGISYFTLGLFFVMTITLLCVIVFGTLKLIFNIIKKLLKKE